MSDTKRIKLSEYGERLAPRVLGREVKSDVQEMSGSGTCFVFDLRGVKSMSTGFAKELFGELSNELSGRFPDRVRFEFGSNKDVLKRTIARGLKASSSGRVPA